MCVTQCELHRDVLQVQVFVVHRVTQLPDPLFHLGNFPGAELSTGVSHGPAPLVLVLVQLQEPDHQVQTGAVQVHVEAVSTQDVHE